MCGSPHYAETAVPSRRVPLEHQPVLLDLPLRAVSVYASHNSYLHTLQVASSATTVALDIVLKQGVRCIELDVFRDWTCPSRVFVAHGQEKLPYDILATTQLSFDIACESIAERAFAETSDPLFLALEINVHRDVAACDAIAATLRRCFGERLYASALTPETPLRALVGRVVVMTGGGTAGTALPGLVNAEWGADFQNASGLSELAVGRAVTRLYPVGDTVAGLLSLNTDPRPALAAGVTFVALNTCTLDEHSAAAAAFFADSSFRAVRDVYFKQLPAIAASI